MRGLSWLLGCITWNSPFEDVPAGGDNPSEGYENIHDVKKGFRERFEKGHKMNLSDGAPGDDGWQEAGTAIGYYQNDSPTTRPDNTTGLSADDNGRLWVKITTTALYLYELAKGWYNFFSSRLGEAITFSGNNTHEGETKLACPFYIKDSLGTTYRVAFAGMSVDAAGWDCTAFTDNVTRMALSPDGTVLYAPSGDNKVRAIDVSDGSVIWTFSGHATIVRAVIVSPDGSTVYSSDFDGNVKEIDASDGSGGWTYAGASRTDAMAISSDGSKLYVADFASNVVELDTSDGSENWTATPHTSSIGGMVISPDDSYLYTTGDDEYVKRLDASDGSVLWSTHLGVSVDGQNIAISPDGSTLYVATVDPVEVAASDGTIGWTAVGRGHSSSGGIAVSPEGSIIYSDNSGIMYALAASDGSDLFNYDSTTNTIQSIVPSHDGSIVYLGTTNGGNPLARELKLTPSTLGATTF